MGDYFVNPYNFISFPKEKAKAYTDLDRHTGFIEYTVTTKTPLFIPNSSSESAFQESKKEADHKSYDFFSYQDLDPTKNYENQYFTPVIPGSEIRGVVRSVYETLADSCMGILNSDDYPVNRKIGGFEKGTLRKNLRGELDLLDEAGTEKEKNLSKENVEKRMFYAMEAYLQQEDEEKKEKYIQYKAKFQDFKQKGGTIEIRYSYLASKESEEKILYLAPFIEEDTKKEEKPKKKKGKKTKKEKEASIHTIGELAGKFVPCEENYCPACDLFGYVGKTNELSRSSKIRFSDLYVTEEKNAEEYYLCNKKTLQILGGPRLGNVEFYLERPKGAKIWTYDYYVTDKNELRIEKGRLRGRKYYWHHRKTKLPKEVEPSNLNKTIRPVKEGISFKGKLYFEKISEKQLKQLIWILNSGTEELGLKLGGAKPLGLGSVSLKVESVEERKITVQNGKIEYKMEEQKLFPVSYEDAQFSKEVKAEFYKIAGLKSVPENIEITYPRVESQKNTEELTEGFKWFAENHSMEKQREKSEIKNRLPYILEEDFSLPYYSEKKEEEKKEKNKRK